MSSQLLLNGLLSFIEHFLWYHPHWLYATLPAYWNLLINMMERYKDKGDKERQKQSKMQVIVFMYQ
jgi:hypothetical protein